MDLIQFVKNHSDLSTDRGFQFEFFCDRCGTGYRTPFQPSATSMVSDAMDVASGLLGGVFRQAATVGDRVHSAAWEKSHDTAFKKAVKHARPQFQQCPRCSHWVCKSGCWNPDLGLCKKCAPDAEVEYTATRVETEIAQGKAAIREGDYVDRQDEARLQQGTLIARCAHCGASLSSPAKFCPECGKPLRAEKFCTECGGNIPASAKFCPECGAAQK